MTIFFCGAIILIVSYLLVLARAKSLYPGRTNLEYRIYYISQYEILFVILGLILSAGSIVYQMIESKKFKIENEKQRIKEQEFEVKMEKVRISTQFIEGFQELLPTIHHLRYIRNAEIQYNSNMKKVFDEYINAPGTTLSFDYKDMKFFLDKNNIDESELFSFVGSEKPNEIREEKKYDFINIVRQSSIIHDFEYKNSSWVSSLDRIVGLIHQTETSLEKKEITKEEYKAHMDAHYQMVLKSYLGSISTILNELECLTMAVKWDLLAYEQIYHLIVQVYEATVKYLYFDIIVARKSDPERGTVTFQNIEIMYKSLMKTKETFIKREKEKQDKMNELQKEIESISEKMTEDRTLMFNDKIIS